MSNPFRKTISLAMMCAFAAVLSLTGWADAQGKPEASEPRAPMAPEKKAPAGVKRPAQVKAAVKKKSSPEVLALQEALKKAGENPGPADGLMGRKTRTALRAFQKKNGLKTTGQADKATMAKLQPFMEKK